MSKRAPEFLLNDILECAEKIADYTEGMSFDDFIHDSKTVDAVIRNLEIMGEAANRLPDVHKERMHLIDWYKIRGLRNRIVHQYSDIDYVIIWSVKEEYLPELVSQINNYLNKI